MHMRQYGSEPAQTPELVDMVVLMPGQVQRRQTVHCRDVQNKQQAAEPAPQRQR